MSSMNVNSAGIAGSAEMNGGDNAEPTQKSDHTHRKALNTIVLQLFKMSNDNIQRFVRSLIKVIAEIPHIFIFVPNVQESEIVSQELITEFNRWLMGRIIYWLGQQEYIKSHSLCIQFLSSFLQLLKIKNCHSFMALSVDLIQLMPMLLNASKQLAENGADVNINTYTSVPNLKDFIGLQLTFVPVILKNFDVCDVLQKNLLNLIQNSLASSMLFFNTWLVDSFWMHLCDHLEFSSINTKQASLDLIAELILCNGGQPCSERFFERWIYCLASLFSLCCSQDLTNYGDVNDLQSSLAQNLKLAARYATRRMLCHTNAETYFHFLHLQKSIAKELHCSGFAEIKNTRLLDAIENLLKYSLKSEFDSARIENVAIVPSIVDGLLKHVGKMVSSEWLVRCMYLHVELQVGQWRLSESKSVSGQLNGNHPEEPHLIQRSKMLNSITPLFASELQAAHDYQPSGCEISSYWAKLLAKLKPSLKLETALFSEASGCLMQMRVICETLEVGILSQVHFANVTKKMQPSTNTPKSAVMWLPVEVLTKLQNIWNAVIRFCTSWLPVEINSVCKIILRIAAALVYAHEHISTSKEMWVEICFFASLPWLRTRSSNQADLAKPSNEVDLVEIISFMTDNYVLTTCLDILAHLPVHISPLWRFSIFREILMTEGNPMRGKALKMLPFLVNTLRSIPCCQPVPLLQSVTNSHDVTFMCELGGIMGNLLLASSSLLRTSRSPHKWTDTILNAVTIDDKSETQEDFQAILAYKLDVEALQEIFCCFVNSPDPKVRQAIMPHLKFQFLYSENGEKFLQHCLKLIGDSEHLVRIAFSKYVGGIIVVARKENLDGVVMMQLKQMFEKAKEKPDVAWINTLLFTAAEIAKMSEGDILLETTIILVEHLSSCAALSAVAHCKLKELFSCKSLTAKEYFLKYRKPICKFLACLIHNEMSHGNQNPFRVFNQISIAFDYHDEETCLKECMEYIMPDLVSKCTMYATNLLKKMGKILKIPYRKLISDYFNHIFAHIVCHTSQSEQQAVLQFVKEMTGLDASSLLKCHFFFVQNELLIRISAHYDQVFQGIAFLACHDGQFAGKRITTSEQMANYLQPHLLGFLTFFNAKLHNVNVHIEDKKLALESLIVILRLMGPKHITDVRLKVTVALKICLQFQTDGFPELSCRAWSTFVRSVEMNALGPMLSQIVVMLLPLLQQRPNDVAAIFHFLIVENKQSLSKHFQDLYFLPDMHELSDVLAALKVSPETPSSQADLKTILRSSLVTVGHESMEVRLPALAKICQILRNSHKTLYQFIQGSDTVDPLISQFVSTLLHGCRDSNANAKALIAECLGELGAIDPGRLEIKSGDAFKVSSVHYNLGEGFAADLINEIARCYFKADTRSQDGSSYAMQELLQVYHCKSDRAPFFKRFPDGLQGILRPLLNSKYIIKNPTFKDKYPCPIFLSALGSNYNDWICQWTSSLMKMVKNPKAVHIFTSCSVVIKHDIGTAMFLLPYILLYAILDNEDVSTISQEILAVVKHDKPDVKSLPSDLHRLCSQTVFSSLDYLLRWCQKAHEVPESRVKEASKVKTFLDAVPQLDLAKVSAKCEAYARALQHLEIHVKQFPHDLQDKLNFFQELYISLDEPDSVAGVMVLRQAQPTLHDQILTHESLGQLQDALSCYELITHLEPNEVAHRKGLLRCLLELDQPHKALNYCNGVLTKKPEWCITLNEYLVEATWKLSSWDDLQTNLNDSSGISWGNGIGHLLNAVNNKNSEMFKKRLHCIRCEYMAPLSTACMESDSYQRGYKHIIKLHMLSELEKGIHALSLLRDTHDGANESFRSDPVQLISEWEARLQFVQPSLRCLEPILNLQRALLGITLKHRPELGPQIEPEIGRSWLKSARLARKNGHLQRAYNSLLVASRCQLSEVFLETSKWLWQKGDQGQAISTLQNGIKKFYPIIDGIKFDSSVDGQREKLQCAKALLYLARYSEESCNLESSQILKMYADVLKICRDWEDSNFYCAQYYDRIQSVKSQEDMDGAFILCIVKHFGESLQYGCKYLYQSMPRMLSLWLEFGSFVMNLKQPKMKATQVSKIGEAEQVLRKINELIGGFITNKIPLYLFLTAFPQLISRICHTHPAVIALLQEIICRLLVTYPQQSMWMMMAVSKSPHSLRAERCQEIFQKAKSLNPQLQKFIGDSTKLTDKLLELCNRNTSDAVMSMDTHFRNLLRLFRDDSFGPILLPLQASMSITVPTGNGGYANHDPFPLTPVYIHGFEDHIEVMQSLQKPKKITLRGSDGKRYTMMCKPKDDLRKDSRLMDFNTVVNRFLRRDPDSRRRQLHIRTYSVVPLNHECGLIEWVPNLCGLRIILTGLYKMKQMLVSGRELQLYKVDYSAPIEKKMAVFKKLVEKHPSVFSEWFLSTFPNPTAWYQARLAYARTLAVMSMVGYILGLGDRHGENILMDSSCGDVVHVDFNCLFNKGETFGCPERVPFRLTHNMVDAMGPLGYEGVYRKSCEATLRVMRDQMEALMSLLKPFVHDPLLEWSRPKAKHSRSADAGDMPTSEMGMNHVQDIQSRLKGIVKGKASLLKQNATPLSIEGQVNYLIQEAIDEQNLCKMYIGWASYM